MLPMKVSEQISSNGEFEIVVPDSSAGLILVLNGGYATAVYTYWKRFSAAVISLNSGGLYEPDTIRVSGNTILYKDVHNRGGNLVIRVLYF